MSTSTLRLWCIGALCAAACGFNESQWDVQTFPDDLHENHVIIVSVCLGLAVLALVASLVYMLVKGGIKLAYLVLGIVACAIVAVGVVAWVVTYLQARDAIHEKSERLLQMTAQLVEGVEAELTMGPELLRAVNMTHFSGMVDLTSTTLDPLIALRNLDVSFRRSSVDLLYYGLEDGRIQAALPGAGGVLVGVTGAVGQFDGCFECSAWDFSDETVCNATRDTNGCGDAAQAAECAATCELPAAEKYCHFPNNATGYIVATGTWPDMATPWCGQAGGPAPFDPRVRPWYGTLGTRGIQWTAPYPFADDLKVTVGFTVVTTLWGATPIEPPIGMLAVDFTLKSVASLLETLPPTENAVVLLVQPNGLLLSSSLSEAALTKDLGVFVNTTVANVTNATLISPASKIAPIVATVAANAGGSLEGMVGKKAIIVKGDTLITVSSLQVEGGLEVLIVMYLPYTDLLGETNDASTIALLAAMGISAFFVVVLGVLLIVVTKPLGEMAHGMDLIAWMKLSQIDPMSNSSVHELQWMQRSFEKMVSNLDEFRTYLPASMLAEPSMDDDDDDYDDSDDESEMFATTAGRAALVFTDVVKSSDSWQNCPQGMRVGLRRHNDVIRKLIQEFVGYEVKTVGDAFMVSFEGEKPGVRAAKFALRVQEALLDVEWPDDLCQLPQNKRTPCGAWNGIRVRIGVHVGEVDIETNRETGRRDFFGHTVNKASRMESNGVAGSVCVTEDVLAEIQPVLAEIGNPQFMEMGTIELKGVGTTKCTLLVSDRLKIRMKDYQEFIRVKQAQGVTEKEKIPNITAPQDRLTVSRRGSSKTGTHRGASGPRAQTDRFRQRLARIPQMAAGMVELRLADGFLDEWTDPLMALNETLSCLSVMLKRTAGTLCTVLGSGVAVAWGIGKRESINKYLEAALKFGQLLRCLQNNDKTASGYFGVCIGSAIHGNVGVTQKFVTTIGPAVSVATHLAQVGADIGAPVLGTSLIGDFVSHGKLTTMQSITRPIDKWTIMQPHQEFVIYEITGSHKVSSRNLKDLRDAVERSHSQAISAGDRTPSGIGIEMSPSALDSPSLRDGSGVRLTTFAASPGMNASPVMVSAELSSIRLRLGAGDGSWGWSREFTEAVSLRDYASIKENCHPDYDPVGFNVGEREGRPLRGPFCERAL